MLRREWASRRVAQERGSWRGGHDSPFPSSGQDLHKGSFGHLPPPGEISPLLRPEVLTYAGEAVPGLGEPL